VSVVHIANNRSADLIGDVGAQSPVALRFAGSHAQRVVWFADDGDVLVVPWSPGEEYLGYVTGLTGTRQSSLRLMVPPPGALSTDVLTPDRLLDPGFVAELRAVARDRRVDGIRPYYSDPTVYQLAGAIGARELLPGHRFNGQGGGALVNSKVFFRALAAAAGAPISVGVSVSDQHTAAAAILEILGDGHPVMLKKEFHMGGYGNEVLATSADVRPIGARHTVAVPDASALTSYLDKRWSWLTNNGAHRLAIERYHPDAVPLYVEFLITDDGVDYLGHGQMVADPIVVGTMFPAPALSSGELDTLIGAGRRIGESYRALGYRGVLSPDAILTTGRELLFCETNGRTTGTTYIHTVIGPRVVGAERFRDRVVIDGERWKVPSFGAALDRLASSGLAFDADRGTGVVLVNDFSAIDGSVWYCVVAKDFETAAACERRMTGLFDDVPAQGGSRC
jgi:hypothetical protein